MCFKPVPSRNDDRQQSANDRRGHDDSRRVRHLRTGSRVEPAARVGVLMMTPVGSATCGPDRVWTAHVGHSPNN